MPGFSGIGGDFYRAIDAKTAAYQCLYTDVGKIITNRGAAGSVTITLPATADIPVGWWIEFFVVADQTLLVQSLTTDTMVAFNDPTADSIAFSTASEKVGGGLRCVWDGTGWLSFVALGIETQTPVIAT